MPFWVMLKKDWSGEFSRVLRDESKKEIGRLVFTPGQPTKVENKYFPALRFDIGKALLPIEDYQGGKPVIIDIADIDLDAFAEMCAEAALRDAAEIAEAVDTDGGEQTGEVIPDAGQDPPTEEAVNGPDVSGRSARRRK